jgi:tol-pal system protein YbgF
VAKRPPVTCIIKDIDIVMKVLPRTFISIAIFCVLLLGCASQRDVIVLDERLTILERQNQELQQKIDSLQKLVNTEFERVGKTNQSAETNLRTRYAGLSANMDAMQQDLRVLSGRLDEVSHQLQKKIENDDANTKSIQAKMDDLSVRVGKVEQRTTELERYLNMEGADSKSGAAKNPNAAATAESAGNDKTHATATQLYATAKQTYDKGQMEKARRQFEQFLKANPNSNNADNAQFWIGESYYREKWYEKAILEYQTVIEKYPKGNKVAAAMLKQGMAFFRLGDKSNAGLVWKELEKRFPGSHEAKIAAEQLKKL